MDALKVEGFGSELAAELEEVADHFNGSHGDALLLIARHVGGAADAREAEIVGISPHQVTLATSGADGGDRLPIDFEDEVGSLEQLQGGVMGLLLRSRQLAGESVPQTGIERELSKTRSLPTFVTEVARTRDLTPHLREITFAGGLEGFRSIAPDQFVYTMVPRPEQGVTIPDGFTMAAMREVPEAERPASAYYTVRRFRPERGELDLWFVLHDHPGGVGGWAARAKPGDRAALWGPRSVFEPPEGTNELLLVGDETALPAIASILESTKLRAHAILETRDEAHAVEEVAVEGASVDWVFRGETPAHESTGLVDALRARGSEGPEWPGGLYAYGAAESRAALAVRRHLRGLGAPRRQVHLTAYWRHGRALNG